MKSIDLTGQKVLVIRDARSALAAGASQVLVCKNCVVTPSARDFLAQHNIELVTSGDAKAAATAAYSQTSALPASGGSDGVQGRHAPNPRLFTTPEAEAVKKEICAVGRKLWMRQFVDGNGGNISYRIGPNEVICTPTLVRASTT